MDDIRASHTRLTGYREKKATRGDRVNLRNEDMQGASNVNDNAGRAHMGYTAP